MIFPIKNNIYKKKQLFETPFTRICHQVFEKCHIYALTDETYGAKIKKAYNDLINQIFFDFRKLVKLYKGSDEKFAVTIIPDIVPGIKECVVYAHLIDGTSTLGEGITVTLPQINTECFSDNAKPLCIKNKDGFLDKVTIVIGIPAAPLNVLKNNLTNIGVIRHEIMHSFLTVISEQLGVNAGVAFWTMEEISKILGRYIPTSSKIFLLMENELTPDDISYLFGACAYYLDVQEYSAWLESFGTEVKSNLDKNISANETYLVFKHLNILLKENRSRLIHAKYPEEILDVIKLYLNMTFKVDTNNTKMNIKKLVNYWIKRSDTYLKKCETILKNFKEGKIKCTESTGSGSPLSPN